MIRHAVPLLKVSDSRRAIRFYIESLGFRLESSNPGEPGSTDPCYSVLERDGSSIHLSSFSGDGVLGGVALLFVEDVDQLREEFRGRGVEVALEPIDQTWGNREMYLRDPDGNSVRFINALPAGAPRPTAAEYRLDEAIPLLERTPATLHSLLHGIPSAWIEANEGGDTYSPYQVVGHLIQGERASWIPRIEQILSVGDREPFRPYGRDAMRVDSVGRSLDELLSTFATLRAESLARLRALDLKPADLARRGLHPELASVTLEQLLATWVAHDLGHIGQVVRVMAKRYRDAVGPWRQYLRILR